MDFQISKMNIEDIDEIYKLGISQKEFASASGIFWSKKQLEKWCQSPNDVLLVAKTNNEIIGFSFYSAHIPTKKVTWENLYVTPSARGLGVAAKLTEEGLKRVKNLGYTYIMLCVNAEDQELFAKFVERYGFKRGGLVLWVDKII
jgi:ribosomal protein S18 acetylase RimI-like enzyme